MAVIVPEGIVHSKLTKSGAKPLTPAEADAQQNRVITFAIMNTMPRSSGFIHTPTQLLRPLDFASGRTLIEPILVTTEEIMKEAKKMPDGVLKNHILNDYVCFPEYKERGSDMAFISGSNPNGNRDQQLKALSFMENYIKWAEDYTPESPTSTKYSCMAGHTYMNVRHGQVKEKLPEKKWGVYLHKVRDENHPLTHGMDTVFDIVHSRENEISEQQYIDSGMKILVDSPIGVHMATSSDGLRAILWQGHPEYNTNSLLKEWKRDMGNAHLERLAHKKASYPPFPENYFGAEGEAHLEEFREKVLSGVFDEQIKAQGHLSIPEETEKLIESAIPNRWSSTKRALLSNWVTAVVNVADFEKRKPFADGVNTDDVFNRNHLDL